MVIARKLLAENFRFVDEVLRALDKIKTELDVTLGLQKQYIKQTAAGFSLKINMPAPKNSPKIEPGGTGSIHIPSLDKLRKNYLVVQDLWDTREALELMEVRIRQAFQGQDVKTEKAINEILKLKQRTEIGLNEAFTFLKGLAEKNLPEKFAAFNRATFSIIEKAIAYETSTVYTYVYEIEGSVCFSTYTHLQRVTDDDGTYYPDLFIVTSYLTGTLPTMHIGVISKFAPPSSKLLMKKVTTVKDTIRGLNILLAMDNFSTSLGSLPLSVLLKNPTIDRSMFLYQEHILSIRAEEATAIFTLKPTVTDKAVADKIITQIYKDFQGMVRNTNAKLSMRIKSAKKCFVLTFYFISPNSSLAATPEDLSFLKERFNLSDLTIKDIVRNINSGSAL
jgi:hypothetical protein